MYEIRRYLTATGRDRFGEWLDGLQDLNGRKAVLMRQQRVQAGNLGDHKHLRDGVWEFRLTVGPGYRVYFGRDGQRLILLLAGGDKRTQKRDIEEAVSCSRLTEGSRMPTISHDEAMSEFYARNPEVALAVLEGMLVEDGPEELLVWMRQMAGAFGGVKGVAAKSKLNATQLYRMLSAEGNPTLTSLLAVLKAMKLRLAVVPMVPEKKKPAAQKKVVKKRRVAA